MSTSTSLHNDVERFVARRARATLRNAISDALDEIAISAEDEFLGRVASFPWRWSQSSERTIHEAPVSGVSVEIYGEDEPHLVFQFNLTNPRTGHEERVEVDPCFCSWVDVPSGLGESNE